MFKSETTVVGPSEDVEDATFEKLLRDESGITIYRPENLDWTNHPIPDTWMDDEGYIYTRDELNVLVGDGVLIEARGHVPGTTAEVEYGRRCRDSLRRALKMLYLIRDMRGTTEGPSAERAMALAKQAATEIPWPAD